MNSILVAAVLLAASPALAKVNPETYRAKLEDNLKSLTQSSVESYFTQSGLEPPELTDVTVNTTIDFKPNEPVLEAATVDVTMTTEHLAPVIREARQQVARTLAAQGFRFTSDAGDQRPLVTLKVGVVAPAHLDAEGRQLQEYATLGALVLGFLATLALAFYLLLRPFLRRKVKPRSRAVARQAHQAQQPPVFGMASDGPAIDLPRMARSEDQRLEEALPPGPVDFKLLARASVAVVRRTFDQLPFDKAFAMLAAADLETRSAVIDKLQLQPAVRERLERELTQS